MLPSNLRDNFMPYTVTPHKLGYTTLWCDHFGGAHFVVALFGVADFVAVPFWSESFWCEFHKNIFFLLLFVSIFII